MMTRRLERSIGGIAIAATLGIASCVAGAPFVSPVSSTGPPRVRAAGFHELAELAGHPGGNGFIDGIGEGARFGVIGGMAYDGGHFLYVADEDNHIIRRVDVTLGAVSTFAGSVDDARTLDGVGSAARFYNPHAILYDGAGALYVADREVNNSLIRKIVVATGAVTTVAGMKSPPVHDYADGPGAQAPFFEPSALAFDGKRTLYVADDGNDVLRSIDLATGTVKTLAGTPGQNGTVDGIGSAARFTTMQALAYRAGFLYVVQDDASVRKLDLASGAVSTIVVAPKTHSGPPDPSGAPSRTRACAASFDTAGLLVVVVVEWFGYAVKMSLRRIEVATGRVAGSTDVPVGADPLRLVAALSAGRGDEWFLADQGRIRGLGPRPGAWRVVAGSVVTKGSADGAGQAATFHGPQGMTLDGEGNLFVADAENHVLRKIAVATGAVSTFAGVAGMAGGDDGAGAAARFDTPTDVVSDGVGSLYVADSGNATVRRVVLATGQVTTIAGVSKHDRHKGFHGSWEDGIGSSAHFASPAGLAYDAARGDLYVTDRDNATVRRIELATARVTTIAGSHIPPGDLASPVGRGCADGEGAFAELNAPTGIAFDGADVLYVADTGNRVIRRVALGSTRALGDVRVSTVAGTPRRSGSKDGTWTEASFAKPEGLAYDGAGTLYVADGGVNVLRAIDVTTGAVRTIAGVAHRVGIVAGPLPARLNDPARLALGPGPTLFVSDPVENVILELR